MYPSTSTMLCYLKIDIKIYDFFFKCVLIIFHTAIVIHLNLDIAVFMQNNLYLPRPNQLLPVIVKWITLTSVVMSLHN